MTISETSYGLLQGYWFLSADATENRAQRVVARIGGLPAYQGHLEFVTKSPQPVIAGLDPAIHAFLLFHNDKEGVDCPVKPGRDVVAILTSQISRSAI